MSHTEQENESSKPHAIVVGLTWVAIMGLVDWKTGPELALSAYYLPGIAYTAWQAGRWPALSVGLIAALVWMSSEAISGTIYSKSYLALWNGSIRLIFFETIAILVSEVRSRRISEQALEEQGDLLKSIQNSMGDGVVVVGSRGTIRVVNPAAERMFSTNPVGLDAWQWLEQMGDSMVKVLPLFPSREDVLSPDFHKFSEVSLVLNPEAPPLHLEITTLPLRGGISSNSGWLLIISDVTDQKEQERRIADAGEGEQRRIGQDLHDGLCQELVSISFAAGTLQERLENEGQQKHAADVADIAGWIGNTIGQARSIARGLYPVGLEEGLQIGLKGLAASTAQHSGVSCEFEQSGEIPTLPESVAINLYRIAQEGVNNALRHANASSIQLSLHLEPDHLLLKIRDNGNGFEHQGENDGIGLHILQNRAGLIGAKLDVQSPLGEGTRVSCRVPLNLEKKIEPKMNADKE